MLILNSSSEHVGAVEVEVQSGRCTVAKKAYAFECSAAFVELISGDSNNGAACRASM